MLLKMRLLGNREGRKTEGSQNMQVHPDELLKTKGKKTDILNHPDELMKIKELSFYPDELLKTSQLDEISSF